MLHGNLVRSRSLDTLIVVKLRHTVFASLNAQRMHGLRCSSGGEAAPPPQSDWRVEPEPGEIKLLSEKRESQRPLFAIRANISNPEAGGSNTSAMTKAGIVASLKIRWRRPGVAAHRLDRADAAARKPPAASSEVVGAASPVDYAGCSQLIIHGVPN